MASKVLGKVPTGKALEKIKQSPNYQNNHFKNLEHTSLLNDESMAKVLWKFINKPKNTIPSKPLPSVKTDLKNLSDGMLVWFGHSSYLIKINGLNILVDPVFSGHASPVSFTTKSFAGTDVYKVEDFPVIDILLISHDHYDHLDYETVIKLRPKTKLVCTSLGVASHLIYWGFDKEKIIEFDWWDHHTIINGIELTAAPARHFSGRSLSRNKTLWSSFILQTNSYKIFIGADSGYGNHFKTINQKFGSFDLAILECGQYNMAWHDIHMLPEETAQASIDLNAKVLMPVHWGKFDLSIHPWDEPIKRLAAKAAELNINLTTPMIGEVVEINKHYPQTNWWDF